MRDMYINRDLELVLHSAVSQSPSVIVTGPRQSGKSTLLKHLFSKSHKYYTLDDPSLRERVMSDPRLFLDTAGDKIIIDEIQYAPEILSYIKISIDEKRNIPGRFLFTGSQQFNLIRHLGESLAGRVVTLELLPFSILEKKGAYPKNTTAGERLFADMCLRGAYPEVVVNKRIKRDMWYSSYVQTYLERDIRSIYNIGNLRDFQRFLQLLASRCGQVLNLTSFSADIGVSVNTIKSWLSILEASRIIYFLMPYYRNFGKRIIKSPKVYFLDSGLLCHLLAIGEEQIFRHPWNGVIFENFCVQETVKTFLNRGKRVSLYYVRTHNGLEVDLILEHEGKVFPIEIKATKTPGIKMIHPIERFLEVFSKLSLGEGFLLSLKDEDYPLSNKIKNISLYSYVKRVENILKR